MGGTDKDRGKDRENEGRKETREDNDDDDIGSSSPFLASLLSFLVSLLGLCPSISPSPPTRLIPREACCHSSYQNAKSTTMSSLTHLPRRSLSHGVGWAPVAV